MGGVKVGGGGGKERKGKKREGIQERREEKKGGGKILKENAKRDKIETKGKGKNQKATKINV